ncbi:ligand-gated ion channel [Bacteriovorax sp. BAL6_X]|uniref:potassium channel family protein n=1 Tax=Bacteriovorax sp. BAL6_X TaxID=1201290 RepID=UPI0003868074|nr:potassium channel family protein [Bacteriovorax sp. BAL6_X]EPZ51008.1 ligand-gated ion channel [Bacteriovorax sp. BAL6_X]
MRSGFRVFIERFIYLFKTVAFWFITIIGNLGVVIFAYVFLHFENGQNPKVTELGDAIWWAFTTITTVGYGDITPITFWGRVTAIVLMIFGTGLFATYTAIFANVMLGRQFLTTGKRVQALKRNVEGMQSSLHREDLMLERELAKINKTLSILNDKMTSLEERNGEKK